MQAWPARAPCRPGWASVSPWLKLPTLGCWTGPQRILSTCCVPGPVLGVHAHSFLPLAPSFGDIQVPNSGVSRVQLCPTSHPGFALWTRPGFFSAAPPTQNPERQVVSPGTWPGSWAHPVSEDEFVCREASVLCLSLASPCARILQGVVKREETYLPFPGGISRLV